MRVTAGIHRGVPLVSPKGEHTRPTLDKVKQAIFSMITSRISNANLGGTTVLDMFAGSGAMGIEAISRGATSAVFVDNNAESISAINQNLAKIKVDSQRATVIRGDYSAVSGKFELIFLDPPYATELLQNALDMIRGKTMLIPGGLIVCEHAINEQPKGFNILATKTYGKVAVTICTT